MSDAIELSASARGGAGKGAARATRRQGKVPAVVYGDQQPPETVVLEYRDVLKQLNTGNFLNTAYMLNVDGTKTLVIPREVQLDPVRDFPMHVDFLRLGKEASITLEIPVQVVGEDASPGIRLGGTINLVRHTIELTCPVDAIPESIEIDVSELAIGDSVHISAVQLPEGVTPAIADRDFTVLTVSGRGALEDEEEAEEVEEEIETEDAESEED